MPCRVGNPGMKQESQRCPLLAQGLVVAVVGVTEIRQGRLDSRKAIDNRGVNVSEGTNNKKPAPISSFFFASTHEWNGEPDYVAGNSRGSWFIPRRLPHALYFFCTFNEVFDEANRLSLSRVFNDWFVVLFWDTLLTWEQFCEFSIDTYAFLSLLIWSLQIPDGGRVSEHSMEKGKSAELSEIQISGIPRLEKERKEKKRKKKGRKENLCFCAWSASHYR